MLDIKKIRKDPKEIKAKLATRNIKPSTIDELLRLDKERRDLLVESEKLKNERNSTSEQIALLQRKKEDQDKVKLAIDQMRRVGIKIKKLDQQLEDVQSKERDLSLHIPNLPANGTPLKGTSEEEVEQRTVGTLKKFDFKPKSHWELGVNLGILDFKRAAKVAGSRFVYYVGAGAKLERAVYNYFLDENTKAGYEEILPPYMVNDNSMIGTGQFPKFRENKAGFEVKGENLNLIPTAEVPLVNFYRNEVIPTAKLPIKFTALTPAFRSEAGSAGKDTKGLIRLHQFNKVEMVQFTKPDESWEALNQLINQGEKLLAKLKLPYQVVKLRSDEMSFTAAMTQDLKVWLPFDNDYREISSCSNTTDFQARRAHIQYRTEDGKLHFIHTLNGSGLAVGRTVAAILENYQNEDGSVNIPEVLQPYMNGQKKIVAKNNK